MWSFSPPDDEFPDEFRSGSPMSMPDHAMKDYQESASMPNLTQEMETEDEPADVDMSDTADAFFHPISDSSP